MHIWLFPMRLASTVKTLLAGRIKSANVLLDPDNRYDDNHVIHVITLLRNNQELISGSIFKETKCVDS